MEMLEDRINAFLSVNYGYGSGYGSGRGSDGGYGWGYGDGSGRGSEGCNGDGSDCCYKWGHGDCSNYGYGWGYGDGSGVKDINGNHVYIVDGIQTIIKSVRSNIAQGFVLQSDLTLKPCYIVKDQNGFAHGDTLHDAFSALQEKLYDDSTEEERIEAFRKKFPKYETPYPNRDLFAYHHVLTGSCRMGRESFCLSNGIDLDGTTTVREFIELTKGSYGGDVICKLPEVYGITEH